MVATAKSTPDEAFMDQALTLADRGRGNTSPNPMVGAVVVAGEDAVVGSGYHERAGMAHAEVKALDEAEEADQGARDATLYCTLEPCSHVGRTGPCVQRIVEAGVRRVVVGMVDPNPQVSGRGIAYLRDHGVQVDVGVRRAAVSRQNEAFIVWVTRGRPFVTMKIATSLDGCIAEAAGVRTRLTSEEANAAVDQLRAEVDAVAVGSTTVLVDDPHLTVRSARRMRPLTRVVFDRRLRVSPSAALFATLEVGPVVIVTTEASAVERSEAVAQLRGIGARVEPLRSGSIRDAMTRLGALEITSLLLEGGATIHRAAWEADVVDRVQRYVAPITLGTDGVAWLGDDISMAKLYDSRVHSYGLDVLFEGYVQRTD